MIAALDVCYDDTNLRGTGAAVVFASWQDAHPIAEITTIIENIQPYIPGEFFRRELPCLLAILREIQQPLDVLIVDSYVQLDGRPGLGVHLYEQLKQKIPVIGVAKTRFHAAPAVEVLRGTSQSPLYVTAIGVDSHEAARHIQSMHGHHRLPTLLKRVDQLSRGR